MKMTDELEVLFSRRGGVGHIKFNRPKALNALNYDMVLRIQNRDGGTGWWSNKYWFVFYWGSPRHNEGGKRTYLDSKTVWAAIV